MTPTEQEKKLREAICKAMHIYPEELQYRLPNSFGESELEAIMQLITADTNKQVEAVLDRLENLNGSQPDSYIATFIEAERNKLQAKGENQ